MKSGMELPQIGDQASAESITLVATEAQRMGLDSVWVLDRLLRPEELAGSPQPVAPAYPFSAFATELHAHWARGGFDEQLRTTVETVRALDMSALADTGDILPNPDGDPGT